ncbi:hypothetical protein C5C27_16885, partial [Rathayibacter sp. AY2B7]|uniref:hypothetical protein n=1 Tax=Rathayibacter sp. AY2B7 TaxID=2080571 RepID=UPI000CE88326
HRTRDRKGARAVWFAGLSALAGFVVISPVISLTSLILGVTSVFFGLTVIAPAAGLVFGILGLRREPTGRTLSIWGIVLNSVMLGLVLLFAIAVLVVVVLVPLAALASGSDYR